MADDKQIFVYVTDKTCASIKMGTLFVEGKKGREIVCFEYDEKWLGSKGGFVLLDPDLKSYRGRQYVPGNKKIFGMLADSSPDRWGRLLMRRREAIKAKKENRKPNALTEIDYMLGVYDETRMGGIRFCTSEGGPFLSADATLAAPPWTTLRKLETASIAFEKNEDGMEEKWLNQLLAPGSSLGGARPKATVQASDESLWIAKFPSKYDEMDIGAWEMVVHELARDCGLNVPEAKLEKFSEYGSTYFSKRFDRVGSNRVHVASAMTLLGKTDGESDECSYLDIASFIRQHGASPQKDLEELWKRIVFFIAVSNTDDHLRNHAFILVDGGWILSPLYDVNPDIYGDSLSLNINEHSGEMRFELALEVSKLFGVNKGDAKEFINSTKNTIETKWRILAKKFKLKRAEIEAMDTAFQMEYKW